MKISHIFTEPYRELCLSSKMKRNVSAVFIVLRPMAFSDHKASAAATTVIFSQSFSSSAQFHSSSNGKKSPSCFTNNINNLEDALSLCNQMVRQSLCLVLFTLISCLSAFKLKQYSVVISLHRDVH